MLSQLHTLFLVARFLQLREAETLAGEHAMQDTLTSLGCGGDMEVVIKAAGAPESSFCEMLDGFKTLIFQARIGGGQFTCRETASADDVETYRRFPFRIGGR